MQLSPHQLASFIHSRPLINPRYRVSRLTAVFGGDGGHGAPEAAAVEEAAEAAAGKVVVAVGGAGETDVVAAAVADGCGG